MGTLKQERITDNLAQLFEVLPPSIREAIESCAREDLLEIILDLGRVAEARFGDNAVVELGEGFVTAREIEYVVERVGSFGKDNRAGIERTLHRISAIRNRIGEIIGLTCRVGRAVYGTIDIIQDVVEGGRSILILGRPGSGKTTKLREVARVLSDERRKRVVIVDTSNEIAGDGDIPHPAIGRARRMQVVEPSLQHAVMIEAVENHMPEVIVIDEIGTEQEAFAARTIAERGVQLIGTAHGNSLENLLVNPTLCDLIGGIQAVTLSDDEAKRRGTQKTVLERKAPPTFDIVIEIIDIDRLAIHRDVAVTVDRLLRGNQPRPEIRVRNPQGEIEIVQRAGVMLMEHGRGEYNGDESIEDEVPARPVEPVVQQTAPAGSRRAQRGPMRVFPYGVNRNRLDRAILETHVPAVIARDLQDAEVIIALKGSYRREPAKMREGAAKNLPTFIIKSNTYAQIAAAIREMAQARGGERGFIEAALREAETAVGRTLDSGEAIELAPQNSFTRRLQHQIIEKHQLLSDSLGMEPHRRVRVLPNA
jgi:stage III sporulation protein SpoIIIAA